MRGLAGKWLGDAIGRYAQHFGISSAVPLRGRLRWASRRWLRILGRSGVLAIGMLVVFPPFYFSAISPAQERLDAARSSELSLRERILHAGKSLDGGWRTPAEQLTEFYRFFPEERHSPQWLERLAALAEKNGLSLNEGEYKVARGKAGRLMRFQIILPVKGEYPRIRSFLAALPAETPIIALEHVQFSRQNIGDSAVEARISLALYLEQAS
ncbi:GspMb/PilO family protein [Candidatus Ferrigenium straubiae]|jgi:Tfp pilus assembly protein PilO|uniref:GspMb/PilO family protein n=1 Tax=Candidatus Ferrigenium straubiae TaxID=2919506 RepID=UPI003F4AA69B